MTETPYGLEARTQEVKMLERTAVRRARRGPAATAERTRRHRMAERLRRVADRLDA